jgi:hypothetical protein
MKNSGSSGTGRSTGLKKILMSDKVNEKCKLNVAEMGAKYSHNLTRCRREIIHLEAFIVGVMNVFHTYNH